ncbi:hypothetical protein Nepgr_029292 [Nepenthes gracilis]|uniref:Uncharacterized protein n=1 Tax=Nepenthes gracilis TaxID=150966 RepID=A0AAD3Y4X3_NEPGR|nr:hypothetical protein Nepgr_029292 [Nepenthes gracilis]
MPPLFVAAPVAAAMPFPAAGPLPPSAAGWAAAAAPGHPPTCLPVPGTGVFLPPPGSSNSSPPPKSCATSPEAGLPGETASQSPQMENCNINASLKGKPDGKVQRQDCNENVAGNSKSLI